jgi:NADH-quinone oxidoreductase subunit J
VTLSLATVLFWASLALVVAGAAVAVLSPDVTRAALGLGGFLVALAGLYLQYGLGFLAAAQVFVYVGGVLVLMLFAIMLVHRSGEGIPVLGRVSGGLAALPAAAVFVVLAGALAVSLEGAGLPDGAGAGVEALQRTLLGPMLPAFEAAGLFLLAALVAAVAVTGGDEK